MLYQSSERKKERIKEEPKAVTAASVPRTARGNVIKEARGCEWIPVTWVVHSKRKRKKKYSSRRMG